MDSSRTFFQEETAYSSATTTSSLLSKTRSIRSGSIYQRKRLRLSKTIVCITQWYDAIHELVLHVKTIDSIARQCYYFGIDTIVS